MSRAFRALGRGVAALWLGLAHAVGALARKIGRGARDLDPEHRRDGIGLFLIGLAVVAAAAVWWQLPGTVMESARTVVSGSVGKVGWLVPLMLVLIGWRNMRDPERNGPAGRQVVGWVALAFGVLGIVQIANGNPQPELGDSSDLQQAGGAVGFVVASLLLDLLRTPYVVVPLLILLCVFGVLVITATPVYQVPARVRALRDRLLGRSGEDEDAGQDEGEPTQPMRVSRRRGPVTETGDIDPEMGDQPYDSPVLEEREVRRRGRGKAAATLDPDATAEVSADHRRRARTAPAHPAAAARRAARAVRRRRLPAAGQRRAAPGLRRTRRAPRPATRWSSGSPR